MNWTNLFVGIICIYSISDGNSRGILFVLNMVCAIMNLSIFNYSMMEYFDRKAGKQ